jgi:branched-chain amino acid transport system substrate-binding protein
MSDDRVFCAEAGDVEASGKRGLDAFKAAYKKKFGTEVQVYATYVYDAAMVMVDAMKRAGSSEPTKYLPELSKSNYQGITGNIALDNKGDIRNGALIIYTYRNRQRVQLAVIRYRRPARPRRNRRNHLLIF